MYIERWACGIIYVFIWLQWYSWAKPVVGLWYYILYMHSIISFVIWPHSERCKNLINGFSHNRIRIRKQLNKAVSSLIRTLRLGQMCGKPWWTISAPWPHHVIDTGSTAPDQTDHSNPDAVIWFVRSSMLLS